MRSCHLYRRVLAPHKPGVRLVVWLIILICIIVLLGSGYDITAATGLVVTASFAAVEIAERIVKPTPSGPRNPQLAAR